MGVLNLNFDQKYHYIHSGVFGLEREEASGNTFTRSLELRGCEYWCTGETYLYSAI